MADNIFKALINKLNKKNNLTKKENEYAFSKEDLANLTKENNKKILSLKEDTIVKPKVIDKNDTLIKLKDDLDPDTLTNTTKVPLKAIVIKNASSKKENELSTKQEDIQAVEEDVKQKDTQKKEEFVKQPINKSDTSYNTLKNNQGLITKKWQEIDFTTLENDILKGKDILNHNYTITYPTEAFNYIEKIRKDYEVILNYFIGFNNEKKGIYNQVTFSHKSVYENEEWKYLQQYIKLLEKIRISRNEK